MNINLFERLGSQGVTLLYLVLPYLNAQDKIHLGQVFYQQKEGSALISRGIWDKYGNVRSLNLCYRKFTLLGPEIGILHNLKVLNLFHNSLVSVPKELVRLVSLQRLDLTYNFLESIPETFSRLISLRVLCLGNNCLMKLPRSLSMLPALSHLELHDNRLKTLPKQFKHLRLSDLSVYRNSFSYAEQEKIRKMFPKLCFSY